jgi:xanthine dehydrogenase small subunit
MRPLHELYPPAALVDDLHAHARDEVLIESGERVCFKPVTVPSAVRFKADHPDCALMSGGTDLGVQINKGIRDPQVVMSIGGLSELRGIRRDGQMLVVGATATLSELEHACIDALPEYARLLYWFGSPPIRNAGTLGGNIANGSPIGDTMSALYVLDAQIELSGPAGQRRININDFYTGYRTSVMRPDELITRVWIPLPPPGEILKLYKVSKRKDLDISAFTAAVRIKLSSGPNSLGVSSDHPAPRRLAAARGTDEVAGNTIEDIRIAYGGVGPVIVRLRETEAFLRGQPFLHDTLARAGGIARAEIRPISDVRGTAAYRAQLAENILRKLFFDVTGWANLERGSDFVQTAEDAGDDSIVGSGGSIDF